MNIPEQFGQDRQIRVFISSTFRDMQAERDVLVKKVFPQLRKLCEELAVAWTEVDLRWGITEQESSEGQVLPLCLAEIERCRPYFIGLLGERYGWVPDPGELSSHLKEEQPWLIEHLQKSVTELEIIHGVLQSPKMRDRSIFYFRDPDYLNKLPADADPKDFQSESPESAEKLFELKNKIRAEYTAGKLDYSPRENYPAPDALGELVLADFTELINKLYPESETPDPIDQEATLHEAYGRSRRLAFVGREELLNKMDNHAATSGAKPLVLTGESGCGKSALLAEWAARWKESHSDDLVIQHYIGSTSESADWQGLVRRVLSELKRAFTIAEEVPIQPEAMRTAMQDWLVKSAGKRRIVLVFDALNQLSGTDAAARQLGWLPFAFPPNVTLIVSSLEGESLDALRKREWPELPVSLFGTEDIASAAVAYFRIFSKKPSDKLLAELTQAAPATCNPLYLRAVLDELRQFGEHKEVESRAAYYLKSSDLPGLFDRILTRWEEDFGTELFRHSLRLIRCARFGLSETELLDLLGKKDAEGKHKPLPRRYWTPLYLAAEKALAQRSGLLTFGHDYLRKAVETRYFKSLDDWDDARLELADWFEAIKEPTDRKLDELPALLRDTKSHERLVRFLSDLPTFLRMFQDTRLKWELHGYWLALEGLYDPVATYQKALDAIEGDLPGNSHDYIFNGVALFHQDAGRYGVAEPLLRRVLADCERVLGKEHPDTLTSVNNLAELLQSKGDYTEAEPLYRRALEGYERVQGKDHTDNLGIMNNLGFLLYNTGDYSKAEPLFRRALEGYEHTLGKEHPSTLTSVNNLALLLFRQGDFAGAEPLYRRVLQGFERVLGMEHPSTLTSVNNLALLLFRKGNSAEAELLFRQALESQERVLGKEHPSMLLSLNNLAELLRNKGDYAGAEPIYRRALEGSERVLGKDHPDMLAIVNNIAVLLSSKGDYAGAEPLSRRALEGREQLLGKEHPDTLMSVNNLGFLLDKKGDYSGAEMLYRQTREGYEKVLGKDHLNTLGSVKNLATLLCGKGDYTGAELLYRQAMEGYERVLGKEHPNTLESVSNLAFLLYKKKNNAEAVSLYRQAMEGYERTFGKDHPSTLDSVNNLGFLLDKKGDYAGAEPLYRCAMEGYERALGKDHLTTLGTVNNLAALLYGKGNYASAEPLYRRVLDGCEGVLGKDHPTTLASMNNLALLLKNNGNYAEAELLYRRALDGYEQVLGKEHPDTLGSVNNLAALLEITGRIVEAQALRFRRIDLFNINADSLPQSLRNLATDYFMLGEFAKAEELLHELLESGFEIPSTYHHLARVCLMIDHFNEARNHVAQAWSVRTEAKPYIIARLLWLQIVTRLLCEPQSALNDGATQTIIGQLKGVLLHDEAFMEWTMEPVLKHLEGKLDPETMIFLSALVATMNDKSNLAALEKFAIWREAKPEPIE